MVCIEEMNVMGVWMEINVSGCLVEDYMMVFGGRFYFITLI